MITTIVAGTVQSSTNPNVTKQQQQQQPARFLPSALAKQRSALPKKAKKQCSFEDDKTTNDKKNNSTNSTGSSRSSSSSSSFVSVRSVNAEHANNRGNPANNRNSISSSSSNGCRQHLDSGFNENDENVFENGGYCEEDGDDNTLHFSSNLATGTNTTTNGTNDSNSSLIGDIDESWRHGFGELLAYTFIYTYETSSSVLSVARSSSLSSSSSLSTGNKSTDVGGGLSGWFGKLFGGDAHSTNNQVISVGSGFTDDNNDRLCTRVADRFRDFFGNSRRRSTYRHNNSNCSNGSRTTVVTVNSISSPISSYNDRSQKYVETAVYYDEQQYDNDEAEETATLCKSCHRRPSLCRSVSTDTTMTTTRRTMPAGNTRRFDLVDVMQYKMLFYIRNVKINSVTCCDFKKFLAQVHVWLSRKSLIRVLFGRRMACACSNVNHAELLTLTMQKNHHTQNMLELANGNRNAIFRAIVNNGGSPSPVSRNREHEQFFDEYATLHMTFVASVLPCNVDRSDVCRQFSEWIIHKHRLLHESYRYRNLLIWERNVKDSVQIQRRINSNLHFSCQESQQQLADIKQKYEDLLRLYAKNDMKRNEPQPPQPPQQPPSVRDGKKVTENEQQSEPRSSTETKLDSCRMDSSEETVQNTKNYLYYEEPRKLLVDDDDIASSLPEGL